MRVGIIGLGYVGLPLAVAFAEAGHDVIGLDADPRVVDRIRDGASTVEDVPPERLTAELGMSSADLDQELARADLACVITPHKEIDYRKVVADAALVLDFRGITRGIQAPNLVRL
jgi:UDP-N-acetyl-D-glucosamine dehydrogenase